MIYVDANATTPLWPEALAAMEPFYREHFGNPSSAHAFGLQLHGPLFKAQEAVAALLGAQDPVREMIFTSGGTESNCTAFHSALSARPERRHLLVSAVEHASVLQVAQHYARLGYRLDLLPVDAHGQLATETLAQALRDDTVLVAVMHANNETGAIFNIAELCARAQARGALCLVDAVQSAGKIPVQAQAWGVDYLSVSGHKFHGPKGVGALYVRAGAPLIPLIHGGPQQMGRRAGTENVAGLVGMGVAAALALRRMGEYRTLSQLRDHFENALAAHVDVRVSSQKTARLPNTSHLCFKGVDNRILLKFLERQKIYASAGAACGKDASEPSHVVRAMGVADDYARGAIRFSFMLGTLQSEVDALVAAVKEGILENNDR